MKVVIAGASGLIGRSLVPALRARGHDVQRLVRRPVSANARDEIAWDPGRGALDFNQVADADAFVNLAGENVAAGRWTEARRERIWQSRVASTRTLVRAIATMRRKPAVLLNASAVGIYGSCGEGGLTEENARGGGFLSDVCGAWEAAAEEATRTDVRVARLRFGVVLARDDGALAKMLPLFRLGLGGRLGTGRQWMSWVSLEDAVAVVEQALTDQRLVGAINVVAPSPVTNAEFTRVLARALQRPAVLPVPRWVLRAVFGQMADETLLASQRAVPQRLSDWGYRFRHATAEQALQSLL